MENFSAQQVDQLIVIQRDGCSVSGAAVDDARQSASATQAAARTRALFYALCSLEFDLHYRLLIEGGRPRPDGPLNSSRTQPRSRILFHEQRTDRFFVTDAQHGVSKQRRDRDLTNVWTGLGVLAQRDGVGHDQFVQI